MSTPLAPGTTIGILGGGQLARMLCMAAARLGFATHVYEPGANCPAAHVATRTTNAPYDNAPALTNFASNVDVITYEFENIPTSALDTLEPLCPIRPRRAALAISQDRLREKEFLRGLGAHLAPFAAINTVQDLTAALDHIPPPCILKTRRFGYDGKGQARLNTLDDANAALTALGNAPAVLEGFISFSQEISVIGARGMEGDIACYDPGANVHEDGILRTCTVPAPLPANQRADAVLLTARIMNALDYIGVMGVELFVTAQGLVVNEIAPRVHNSGHWTQNGCVIDQFEQHIRAITGWPLGDGIRHADVVMTNLIGDDMDRLESLAADPANALHLYGKTEARSGRKMGHFNRVTPRITHRSA